MLHLLSGAVAGAVVLAVVGAAVHQGAAVVGAAVGLTGAAVVPGGSTVVGLGVAGVTVVGAGVMPAVKAENRAQTDMRVVISTALHKALHFRRITAHIDILVVVVSRSPDAR
jgi:hypothetical protein